MQQLERFKKQVFVSLLIGITLLCMCPLMNQAIFYDETGLSQCQILDHNQIFCAFEGMVFPCDPNKVNQCGKKLKAYQSLTYIYCSLAIGIIISILFMFEQYNFITNLQRKLHYLKPIILCADVIFLIFIAITASDIEDNNKFKHICYPIIIYLSSLAYLFSAYLFSFQKKYQSLAYFELSG